MWFSDVGEVCSSALGNWKPAGRISPRTLFSEDVLWPRRRKPPRRQPRRRLPSGRARRRRAPRRRRRRAPSARRPRARRPRKVSPSDRHDTTRKGRLGAALFFCAPRRPLFGRRARFPGRLEAAVPEPAAGDQEESHRQQSRGVQSTGNEGCVGCWAAERARFRTSVRPIFCR
jgi:hypothetical protein